MAALSPAGSRVQRYQWFLYVVLAFFGAMLTFVGARAQQKASDDATFRKLIDGYCAAWSSGKPENAAKDLKTTRHGNIAWTTVSMRAFAKMKNGTTIDTPVRYTGIWEKRGKSWVLVHEHLSAPIAG
jgi:ketosteroid isomerase-like protein